MKNFVKSNVFVTSSLKKSYFHGISVKKYQSKLPSRKHDNAQKFFREIDFSSKNVDLTAKNRNRFLYSVSSLETTIFCQISHFFRRTFLSFYLTLDFQTLMGGNRGHVLPPIRVWKFKVNQELRKVCLKLTLTNKIISRKIVVSRIETLYVLCTVCKLFSRFKSSMICT